jgi:hypothetical protein
MRKSYLSFETLAYRICKIRLKGCFRHLTLISAHAPTEEANEDEKNSFYDKLDKEYSKVPRYDMLIFAGDFTAKVDREKFVRPTAGKRSLHHETKENGKLLVQLAESSQLITKSTYLRSTFYTKTYIRVLRKHQILEW